MNQALDFRKFLVKVLHTASFLKTAEYSLEIVALEDNLRLLSKAHN
jgi:hypothetical protein